MFGAVTESAGWRSKPGWYHSSQSISYRDWSQVCLEDRVLPCPMIENPAASLLSLASNGEWLRRFLKTARVRSLKGKYAFVRTSSSAFAARKQLEIEAER